MTSGKDRHQTRRTEAARRSAKRRHPANGGAQHIQLHAVPTQPDRQPPGMAETQAEETTMNNPADHRDQLRALLAQAADYAAALDSIDPDDQPRLLDLAIQIFDWKANMNTSLIGIVTAATHAEKEPVSPWEIAARQFDPPDDPHP